MTPHHRRFPRGGLLWTLLSPILVACRNGYRGRDTLNLGLRGPRWNGSTGDGVHLYAATTTYICFALEVELLVYCYLFML